MFSQHSRRHSNDTNSDLSDDEIFLPDEAKCNRRTSKTGDILASPTHRKLTPTHFRSTGSSPIKRISKISQSEFRSLDNSKLDNLNVEEIHEHYRNVIDNMKKSHEDSVKNLKYRLKSFEGSQADDEYVVSNKCQIASLYTHANTCTANLMLRISSFQKGFFTHCYHFSNKNKSIIF